MSQNLISLALTADQLTAIEGALATLEQNMSGLIALQPAQRRALIKMGDKSEVFCRQTLKLLQQNPQVVPPSLSVDEAQVDLAAYDQISTFSLGRDPERVARPSDHFARACAAAGARFSAPVSHPAISFRPTLASAWMAGRSS